MRCLDDHIKLVTEDDPDFRLVLVDDDPDFLCKEIRRVFADDVHETRRVLRRAPRVLYEDEVQNRLVNWVRRPLDNEDVRKRLIRDWVQRTLDDDDIKEQLALNFVRLSDDDAVQDRLVPDRAQRDLDDHHGKTHDELRSASPYDQEELQGEAQPEQAVFVSKQEVPRDEPPPPPLDHLRRLLQTRLPVLYAEVLEPTLADLRKEYSTALAKGSPLEARCVLLQGCGALAAAAVSQVGSSLLGRITALWQARSSK